MGISIGSYYGIAAYLDQNLDGQLLPFRKQRIASADLATVALPGQQLLIVENESCQHQLPALPNTIAVLGAGFDLDWTANPDLRNKRIAYWGDIDSWGLHCLSKAKQSLPHLSTLMMSDNVYRDHADAAVPEPVIAGTDSPAHLNDKEKMLYQFLLTADNGRLEQEFLPYDFILQQINQWAAAGPE